MNSEEKKRLKKIGKTLVETRSKEFKKKFLEANPAKFASKDWIKNYRNGIKREQEIRNNPPPYISAKDANDKYVLSVVPDSPHGVKGWYFQCEKCGDLLHSCVKENIQCSCSRLKLTLDDGRFYIHSDEKPKLVKLIGRGSEKSKDGFLKRFLFNPFSK